MSDWPKTQDDLRVQGYRYDSVSVCSGVGCGMRIYWWRTPKGAMMPLSELGQSQTYEPHWASCPDAQSFRRKKTNKSDNKGDSK